MEDTVGENIYLGEMIGGADLALLPRSLGGAFPNHIHGCSRITLKQLSPYGWLVIFRHAFFCYAANDTQILSYHTQSEDERDGETYFFSSSPARAG